jgi:hypothetical protein
MKPFETTAPAHPKWDGGYGSGRISPSDIATQLFKGEIPGAMLCCYMLRRFGWPNTGSDEYKNLMEWDLTTPIPGLLLSVTPYLGATGEHKFKPNDEFSCANLHFGIRFTKEVNRKIDYDAGREHWFKRHNKFIMDWWHKTGIKLYCWGHGDKEGDRDELVHTFCDDHKNPGKVFGLWRRTSSMKRKGDIHPKAQMVEWWLGELIKEKHPEVTLPKMTSHECRTIGNPFRRKCETAIRHTMLDLLRPTNVRDISFSVFGNIERAPEAIKRYKNQKPAGYFEGAGNTPEYWFSKEGQAERKKAKASRD